MRSIFFGKHLVIKMLVSTAGLLFLAHAEAATVTPDTLAAWNEYVQESQAELTEQLCGSGRFLWIEGQPTHMEKVRSRGTLALHSPKGGGVPVPSGLVHHWIGTVFIPNVRVFDVLAVLQNYDSYAELYGPAVSDSKLMGRPAHDEFNYQLKFVQKGFGVKAGLLGEFRSTYFRLDARNGYSITRATRLVELANPNTPNEQALPLEASRGYVERMYTIVRYRETDDGVYVEVDALTLSRDIPASVRWLVSPLVQRFSKQLMTATLEKLRDKVASRREFESASR